LFRGGGVHWHETNHQPPTNLLHGRTGRRRTDLAQLLDELALAGVGKCVVRRLELVQLLLHRHLGKR
jgi:hypothetical protein